jgi:2-keto-3-deoxy-6-phosphogluconate aldolase
MSDDPKGGRFFIVKEKDGGARCLVEAHTTSAALRRAAAHYCEAYPAKAGEIVEMMKAGCEVIEIAPGEDIPLPLPVVDQNLEDEKEDGIL